MLHPILKDRRRLFLYLVLWVGIGELLAAVIVYGGGAPLGWALKFALPLALLLGFQSLGSWYLVRALPAESTPMLRLLVSWGVGGALSVGVWVAVGLIWASSGTFCSLLSVCRQFSQEPSWERPLALQSLCCSCN